MKINNPDVQEIRDFKREIFFKDGNKATLNYSVVVYKENPWKLTGLFPIRRERKPRNVSTYFLLFFNFDEVKEEERDQLNIERNIRIESLKPGMILEGLEWLSKNYPDADTGKLLLEKSSKVHIDKKNTNYLFLSSVTVALSKPKSVSKRLVFKGLFPRFIEDRPENEVVIEQYETKLPEYLKGKSIRSTYLELLREDYNSVNSKLRKLNTEAEENLG